MDAMVTARMPSGKKMAGNEALAKMGTNASQAINQLYDYVISHQALPFRQKDEGDRTTRLSAAKSWVDELSEAAVEPRFASMSDAEIRSERLAGRGLLREETR